MTKKKDTRTRAEAKKLMWEYYWDNRASLPKWIGECREEIIELLSAGNSPSIAFEKSSEQDDLDKIAA